MGLIRANGFAQDISSNKDSGRTGSGRNGQEAR